MIRNVENNFSQELLKIINDNGINDKTLFIIDTSRDEVSVSLFSENDNFILFDAKLLNIKYRIQKKDIFYLLYESSFYLTNAMIRGKILVVRMGDSIIDFNNTFCDEYCISKGARIPVGNNLGYFKNKLYPYEDINSLPRCFLLAGGNLIKDDQDLINRLLHKETNIKKRICHPNFKVIITSTLPVEQLRNSSFGREFGLPSEDNFNIQMFP